MPTFNARLQGNQPIAFENVSAGTILGGRLAVPSANATTDPSLQGFTLAGDAATNVLGITEHDTVPVANRAALENAPAAYDSAYNVTDASVPGATTTIYNDVTGYVTYGVSGTAVAYGDPICAAALGAVRRWVSGTDAEGAKVGTCRQPGGVPAAGSTGALARIRVAA